MASDLLTRDLFPTPAPKTLPGSLDLSAEIARRMAVALKSCPHDRIEVAARISRLTGRELSVHMLNAYCSEARDEYIPNLQVAIAFDTATEGFALLSLAAECRGASINVGDDILLAELGRIEVGKQALAQREQVLRQEIKRRRKQ
jgi:hypothetical protein